MDHTIFPVNRPAARGPGSGPGEDSFQRRSADGAALPHEAEDNLCGLRVERQQPLIAVHTRGIEEVRAEINLPVGQGPVRRPGADADR